MVRAFNRDFERNGPSTSRIVRSTLAGWRRYKNHPEPRVRRRYEWEARELGTTFSALVGAARLYYRKSPAMFEKLSNLLKELHAEFGWKSRLYSAIGGRYVLHTLRKEEQRLNSGWTYEPPTFYEKNEHCDDLGNATLLGYVTPHTAAATPAAPLVRLGAGEPVTV
jgi:hypothetical protein